MNETDTQVRLRRAKESLAYYREQADNARQTLAAAKKSARNAKERYEALFLQAEKEAVAQQLSEYRHCTK